MTKDPTTAKVNELKDELMKLGLWKKEPPLWVGDYSKVKIATEQDFADWLQFVYLPNLLAGTKTLLQGNLIVPQAIYHFGKDIKKGQLLQLLIELDSTEK